MFPHCNEANYNKNAEKRLFIKRKADAMSYEELVEQYIREGYAEEEAEEKALEEFDEMEHLEWLKYQDFISRRS